MKCFIACSAASLLLLVAATAPAQTNTLDLMAQQAAQRTNDYLTGTDLQRDQALYQTNYLNDAFWQQLWQRSGANSDNWYEQLRILKIHLLESAARLQASVACITRQGELLGADSRPVSLSRNFSSFNSYYYVALINGTMLTEESFPDLVARLQTAWNGQSTTDPTGQFAERDFDILNLSTADASAYLQARASRGDGPDISLFNLLITDEGVSTVPNPGATATNNIAISDDQLAHPDYASALRNMQAAGATLPPADNLQPNDVVQQLRGVFDGPGTDPVRLRQLALESLYGDLMAGHFDAGQNAYQFTRPVNHSAAFYAALADYSNAVDSVVGDYQILAGQLTTQLAQADERDQEMLGLVADYRAAQQQQPPIGSAISDSQARQIFSAQVGDMNLSSIPLLSVAQYFLYEIGPPWASTTGWTVPFGYIPNPLYYTITAQLIRGLEGSLGEVFTGTQSAMNALKNQTQQEAAINDLEDLETKRADSAILQDEQSLSYGDQSYIPTITGLTAPAEPLPLLDHSGDFLTSAAMSSAGQERQILDQVARQNEALRSSAQAPATLLERASLTSAQAAQKTQALGTLGHVINDHTTLRASAANLKLQQALEKKQLEQASRRMLESVEP